MRLFYSDFYTVSIALKCNGVPSTVVRKGSQVWNFRNWSRVRRLSASKVQAVSLPYCLRDKFGFCYTSWFIIETIGKIIFNLTWNFWVRSEQDCEPNTWRKITKDLSPEEDVLPFKWTRFILLARSMLRRSLLPVWST